MRSLIEMNTRCMEMSGKSEQELVREFVALWNSSHIYLAEINDHRNMAQRTANIEVLDYVTLYL